MHTYITCDKKHVGPAFFLRLSLWLKGTLKCFDEDARIHAAKN